MVKGQRIAIPALHVRLSARKPEKSAYPKERKTLGDHLRKRRLDLGLLQREVAERLGVSEGSVWEWERNRAAPKVRSPPSSLSWGTTPIRHRPLSLPGSPRG